MSQEEVIDLDKASMDELEATCQQKKKVKLNQESYFLEENDSGDQLGNLNREFKYQFNNEENIKAIPWKNSSTLEIENPLIRFHNEIIDFYEYIKPSEQKHKERNQSVERIKKLIQNQFQDARIDVFGSHRTQLYLPSGDIDLVVIEENIQTIDFQEKLRGIFENNKDYHKLTIIRSARVPIIKVIEKQSDTSFDISLNKTEGLDQIAEINKALNIYPEMKYVIFVLKCFLKQRDFNETYSGGDFVLHCKVLIQELAHLCCIAWSQLFCVTIDKSYKSKDKDQMKSYYQKLLLSFLSFMESNLIVPGGSIKNKQETNNNNNTNNTNNYFTLINPLNNEQDLGSAAFRIKDIFAIFKNRYNFLMNYNFQINESILKSLINPCCDDFSYDY